MDRLHMTRADGFLFMAIIYSISVLLSGATKIISSQQQQASTEFKAPVFGKNGRAEKAVKKKKASVDYSINKSIEDMKNEMEYELSQEEEVDASSQEEEDNDSIASGGTNIIAYDYNHRLDLDKNYVEGMFGTDDLCDGMFSDIVVNFAVERDQRYLLAQDIYLVLKTIQTVVISNDEAFALLKQNIANSAGSSDQSIYFYIQCLLIYFL